MSSNITRFFAAAFDTCRMDQDVVKKSLSRSLPNQDAWKEQIGNWISSGSGPFTHQLSRRSR